MLPNEQLEELLIASARGDERAFAALYKLTSPHLFALCLRILKRRERAEEALQEAFVQIWYGARDYYADRGTPMSWLTAIVRHRALDLLRRERSQNNRVAELARIPVEDEVPDVLEHVIYSRDFRLFWDCLQRLQDTQRQCLLLSYYHGYTHTELAAQLQQPLGTVKAWIRRGLKAVQDCLGL